MMNFNQEGSYQNSAHTEADFQRIVQKVVSNIQKILQNVSSIQRMIPQIGTAQDDVQFQNKLHEVQHYTGQLAKETSSHLRELNTMASNSDQKQWRLQRERLHNDFSKALNSFQATQRTAAQREKEEISKSKKNKLNQQKESKNLIDVEDDTSPGGSNVMTGQSKTQMLIEEEQELQRLHEREQSVRQLESDIVDVNSIFKDLATMVHEQGEMVDSIEANIQSTHIRVEEGTEQLMQAERSKISARKKKVICIAVLVAILILVIVIGTQFN